TGSVTFFEGYRPLATVPLVAGKATYSIDGLRVGLHPFRAVYSGDASSTVSTAYFRVTVARSVTDTTLTAPSTLVVVGEPVTVTAKVTARSAGATPIGVVTFKSGSTVLGTAALNGRGEAKLTVNVPGSDLRVTAEYSGSSICQPSV